MAPGPMICVIADKAANIYIGIDPGLNAVADDSAEFAFLGLDIPAMEISFLSNRRFAILVPAPRLHSSPMMLSPI